MIDYTFSDGGSATAGYDHVWAESADCAVRSIAIALEAPYREIYEDLSHLQDQYLRHEAPEEVRCLAGKPIHEDGVFSFLIARYLEPKGWTFMRFSEPIPTGPWMDIDHLPDDRLVLHLEDEEGQNCHYTAFIHHQLHDTYPCLHYLWKYGLIGYWTDQYKPPSPGRSPT